MVKLNKRTVKEGKQVGDLYHACSFNSMLHIAETDCLDFGATANVINMKRVISFTRNPEYIVDTIYHTPIIFILTIDGDKLSDKYKTQPYAAQGYRDRDDKEPDEFEEVSFGRIDHLSKYIKAIRMMFVDVREKINLTSFKTILEYLNEHHVYLDTKHPVKKLDNRIQSIFTGNTIKDYLNRVQSLLNFQDNWESSTLIFDSLFDDSSDFFYFNDDLSKPVKKYREPILKMVKRWSELLDAKPILFYGEFDLKRKSNDKLSTILNNPTYKMESLGFSPNIHTKSTTPFQPYITISVYNSKGEQKKYTISFSF